jgi:arabinogalactan oligomer / maltooligosaccharide transport system permease protein
MAMAEPGREERASRPGAPRGGPDSARHAGGQVVSTTGTVVKLVLLAALNALVLAAMPTVLRKPDYGIAVFSLASLLVVNVVYLSRRVVPLKYLVPGTFFLVAFAVYPVIYLVYISTTNYGTGNSLTKAQAIARIEEASIAGEADAVRYELQVLAEGDAQGPIAFLLTDPEGGRFLGTADGLRDLDQSEIVADGRRETIDGYVALNVGQAQDRVADVNGLAVPGPTGEIVNDGFGAAFAKVQRLTYDAATDTMTDVVDNVTYRVEDGFFVSDGERLLPGWRSGVGLTNYSNLFGDDDVRGPFVRVFVWTMVFATLSVLTTFAFGMLLALAFNSSRMRFRRFYRSLIIIPYALPSFMTALVWRGMFNQRFGAINEWLGTNLPWLDGQWLPYVSILIVNLWLGYPYMFLVTTGALQSIPSDLTEAAAVDGANGPQAFRRVTFPLLLAAVAPLLIASFAFNFNNFNIIYLLTEGNPPISGSEAGRTDILISYTYKLAFEGGDGADYGFSSAVSLVIFFIVAAISAVSFRASKTFEEIR